MPAISSPSLTERLFTIVTDNSTSMVNLIVVAVILLVEYLAKGVLFTCPCQEPYNTMYGSAFLAAPAASFFMVGTYG